MKHVALITGGAGFLGQHLVKYIEDQCVDHFEEIRIADRQLFRQFLPFERHIPITSHLVDCSHFRQLHPVVEGVTVVFNLCGRALPLTIYEDSELLHRDNVKTVEVLKRAMLRHNVPHMIHISDGFVAGNNWNGVPGYTEIATQEIAPDSCVFFGEYGNTKYRGEQVARKANGLVCCDRKTKLHTLIVRPTVIYGEGDSLWIPKMLQLCNKYGYLPEIGNRESQFELVYAGNVAHLLLTAFKNLEQKPNVFAGELFFCNDYRPAKNFFAYLEPFANAAGFNLIRTAMQNISILTCILCDLIFAFIYRINPKFKFYDFPNHKVVIAISYVLFSYDTKKQSLLLKYRPLFDPDVAMKNTIEWWRVNHDKWVKNNTANTFQLDLNINSFIK